MYQVCIYIIYIYKERERYFIFFMYILYHVFLLVAGEPNEVTEGPPCWILLLSVALEGQPMSTLTEEMAMRNH